MILKITNIKKLTKFRVALIDGILVSGNSPKTGSTVTLVRGDLELPIRVTGIVLPSRQHRLTLNVDINQMGVDEAKIGDVLVQS